uniref:Sushi domain containing 1 n=1 Tax=Poecilia latipinna TaxID=48699 RepID=A0A3B3U0V4_9TELE
VLDVCATCHPNATCEDKPDGSGKVCNCNYGFVGNGRTHCQKDECQIGASKICGQHTTCHNTYGSYYCTCLSGYRPSNNMAVFIPNDGTHCRIDECRITGQCGEGGQCRNLEGSFDCSCQIGYKVHNGAEPFRPQRGGAACKVVDCGPPVLVEDSVLLSITVTTYGGVARFGCEEGFVWRRGDNSSVCGADGSWSESSLVTLCGDPPVVPHTVQVWDGSFTPGSTAAYYCNLGFYHHEGSNVSVCADNGYWTVPGILVDCGEPTSIPHAIMEWDNISTVGSKVVYRCDRGFVNVDEGNVSVCTASGGWDAPSLSCQVNCGPPKCLPNTNLLWDGSSTPGSVARCECVDGFYQESGNDLSTCSLSGVWGEVSVKKCGPVPFLAHSEVVWHNRSVVIHRCVAGYHSWRGVNASVCSGSGLWLRATLNQVVYLGSRDYQRSFLDKGRRQLSSKGDRLIICLRLLPLTNYSISITAVAARFTATITANTSLTPVVHYTELETPVPTLRLKRSPNTLDPIFYQIFVLPVEELVVFDCSSPASLDPSSRAESPAEYLTAQLGVQSLGAEVNFTVGDGVLYGGFYNAPLQSGNTYFIVLRV